MMFVVQDMRRQRPDARIRTRVREAFPAAGLNPDLFTLSHHDNVSAAGSARRLLASRPWLAPTGCAW